MSTTSLNTLLGSLEPAAAKRLISYLHLVKRGNPIDYRSPLYGKTTLREDILDMVDSFAYTGVEAMDRLERSEREKVGPYSIRLPWEERRESLQEYFRNPSLTSVNKPAMYFAYEKVLSLSPRRLLPLNIESAYGLMPRNTNLGLPKFSRMRSEEKWYLNEARKLAAQGYPFSWYPSVVGWRGQPRGLYDIPKQRNVWMASHVETIIGKTIVEPMVSVLRSTPEFAAWNPLEIVDFQITRMFNNATQPLVSIDFKSFDQSMSRFIIEHVFSVIRQWFPESENRKITWLQEFFLTSGIVDPDGLEEGRDGSVPSGSSATNLVDSLGHILAAHYIAMRLGNSLRDITVLGDDGVWSFDRAYNLEDLVAAAAELGLTVSADKSSTSMDEVHFLQRLHLRSKGISRGKRSVFRTVGSMISFERFRDHWKPEYNTVRWIMQCENCVNDDNFRELVEFLFDGDKLLHELDPARIFKAAGGAEAAKSFLNLRSFPYKSSSPDRFDTFQTVKILREIQRKERSVALL